MFKILLVLSCAIACALAARGIDIASFQGPFSVSEWECFQQTGDLDFAIIQIWRGGYQLNTHWTTDYDNARAAGITYVDAYAYICNNCVNNTPDAICSAISTALPQDFSGMLWLDIEDCTDCWVGTPADRLSFLEEITSTCVSKGLKMGMYSGMGSWEQVFGSASYTSGTLSNYPLWYAHYDNEPNFSDFSSVKFGNWNAPAIKQYNGNTMMCGQQIDLDAY